MRIHLNRMVVLVATLGMLTFACGGGDGEDPVEDQGTQTDTGSDEGSGDLGVDEGSEDLGVDEGTPEDTAPPVVSYATDVQPILQIYCNGCHSVNNAGGHNITSTYEDSFLDAASCAGETIGACSVSRSADGTMPPGPTTVSPEELAIMQAWVDGGMQP